MRGLRWLVDGTRLHEAAGLRLPGQSLKKLPVRVQVATCVRRVNTNACALKLPSFCLLFRYESDRLAWAKEKSAC